jgi:protein phosphatase
MIAGKVIHKDEIVKSAAKISVAQPQGKAILEVVIGGASKAGKKAENQDAFAALQPSAAERESKGIAIAIADGVSSASHAAQASQMAVTQFIQSYYATAESWSTDKSAAKVLKSLNQWLFSQGARDRDFERQGENNSQPSLQYQANAHQHSVQWLTTFTSLIVKSCRAYIFHVGDTRVGKYHHDDISGDTFESITRDHNQKHGLSSSVLTRALGADSHLRVDQYQLAVDVGDVFVLTSDGVHENLSNQQLVSLLSTIPKQPSKAILEQLSSQIIAQAITAGSQDNVSCVLVYIQSIPKRELTEIQQDLLTQVIPPALQVGQKLDGYQVKKILHASVRSHLYLAEHADHEAPLVLKVPSVNFIDDAIYIQGFLREGWVGERIKHRNVMQVIAKQQRSKSLYHVCQFIDGQPLSEWMHDNPSPSIAQVRDIVCQIISALRAFQRLDLVHRDLKPDNIMINSAGQITLIDYGTALIAAQDEIVDTLPETVPQGTLNYIAPETLLTMHADHQSDLFSLGVVCYEMLSGSLPYKPMASCHEQVKSYPSWQYRSIMDYRPDLPLWLDLTLQKSVQADPKARYQAFSEFLADLSKPSVDILQEYQNLPLIKRYPVQFWQAVAFLLFIALLISFAF